MSRFAFLAVFATLIVLSGARGADAQQMSISITLPANNQTFGLQANVGVSGACSQKNATVNVQVTDSNKNVIQSGTCTSSATDEAGV